MGKKIFNRLVPTVILLVLLSCSISEKDYCNNLQDNITNDSFEGIVLEKTRERTSSYKVLLNENKIVTLYKLDSEFVDNVEVGDSVIKKIGSEKVILKKKEGLRTIVKYYYVPDFCRCNDTYPYFCK